MWSTGVLGNTVTFKSSQTPLIYDPMSAIVFGYASCTGVSILFADALRAAGVPARLAGTPAWNGDPNKGNHNWIEVYFEGEWRFIEAEPAGPNETLDNPCDKWFCSADKMEGTMVYATRWAREGTTYPMAWDTTNTEVPGVNRTEYYQQACNAC
jgi:transglutaminase-like putative cysteine protease